MQPLQNNTSAIPVFDAMMTDPDQVITLSEDTCLYDNQPTNFQITYRQLFERLSTPDPRRRTKDGPGWYTGPCAGTRHKQNFTKFWCAVLDADSSVDIHGKPVDGAPSPKDVHNILKESGVTHHIYTTHSHGGVKGNRYRIVVPIDTTEVTEIRGALLYILELLHNGNQPIYLTKESYRIPNRWHYPRIETRDAIFYSATHWGTTVDGRYLAWHYHQLDPDGRPAVSTTPHIIERRADRHSIIDRFCTLVPMTSILETHGYTFHGQHLLIDEQGRETHAMRYRPKDSSSPPGVIVLEVDGKQRVFSHHTNDPLHCDGARDAYDAYMALNEIDASETQTVARDVIEEIEVANMNRDHACVNINGEFKYVYARPSQTLKGITFDYMSVNAFQHYCLNEPGIYIAGGDDGMTLVPRYNWWVNNTRKIKYGMATFRPLPLKECAGKPADFYHFESDGKPIFNLFNGWRIEPKKGSCDLIKWHIRHALCSDNEEHYQYFLQWLAHIVQYPQEKPGTALVLQSGKGTGKSVFSQALVNALAPMGAVIPDPKSFVSHFNASLKNKLLVILEESFFAGNPGEEGKLKAMITDSLGMSEEKFQRREDSIDFIRVMIQTNNLAAVPASDDERRFFVPVISEAGILRNIEEQGRYFPELVEELNGSGMKAFFFELMNLKIDRKGIHVAPDSDALQKQKLYALHGIQAWLGDFLVRGTFSVSADRQVSCQNGPRETWVSYKDLIESISGYGKRHDLARSRIIKALDEIEDVLGTLESEDRVDDRYIRFPPLDEMRKRFGDKFKLKEGWYEGF